MKASSESARAIGDHPLVLKTGDEIEALSHAFNKMAVNLKQSFSQLNTQNGGNPSPRGTLS